MKLLESFVRRVLQEESSSHSVKEVNEELQYLIQQDSGIIAVTLYADDGWEQIGKMDSHWYPMSKIQKNSCYEDILKLGGGKDPSETVLGVYDSRIENPQYRGKGYGRAMYEATIHEAFAAHGPFFFVPMECTGAGTTTSDALRVWSSLSRDFPSSGKVIYVNYQPTVVGVVPLQKN